MRDPALQSTCLRCNQPIHYDGSLFQWFHYPNAGISCSMNPPEPSYINGLLNIGNLAVHCASCGHSVCPTTWDQDCAFCGKIILSKGTLDTLATTNILDGVPPSVETLQHYDPDSLDYLEGPRG